MSERNCSFLRSYLRQFKHFSGEGRQEDFVRGCNVSSGGKSFIAMGVLTKNDTVSKIQPILTLGAALASGKNDVDYIVKEYGVARLRGKTAGEMAKTLIQSVIHPCHHRGIERSIEHHGKCPARCGAEWLNPENRIEKFDSCPAKK